MYHHRRDDHPQVSSCSQQELRMGDCGQEWVRDRLLMGCCTTDEDRLISIVCLCCQFVVCGQQQAIPIVVVAGAGMGKSLAGLLTGCCTTNEDELISIFCLCCQFMVRGGQQVIPIVVVAGGGMEEGSVGGWLGVGTT